MSENLHLVFSKPPEAISDEEYNRWYDFHLGEILVVPGFVSARRYRLQTVKGEWTPSGHRYLSAYELEGDPGDVMRELDKEVASGRMQLPSWFPAGPRGSTRPRGHRWTRTRSETGYPRRPARRPDERLTSRREDPMSVRTTPPFRADHVGSLLRPRALLQAREDAARGAISLDDLRAIEDAAIRDAVAMQADIGLRSVTDGEFRRASWHLDFIYEIAGNFRSSWVAQGGYDFVADALFNELTVDGYFMEFDDERSGGFAPLRFVPKGKYVVLGLVTSKKGQLEAKDDIKRRIEEASKFVDIDQLCLSPQCGFSSTLEGNSLSRDQQIAKLRLVAETAEEVWGTQ